MVATLLLVGCGGAAASVSQGVPGTGRAAITIKWPALPKAATRVVPEAANSIVVDLKIGTTDVSSGPIARPTSSWTSPPLAAGTYTITATAYPNANGSGNAQAVGTGSVVVVDSQNTAVGVTMGSTVTALTISPPTPSVNINGSINQLSISATDSKANIVLVASDTIHWTSSNPSVATISATGLTPTVTGLVAGNVTISATFTEVEPSLGQTPVAATPVTLRVGPDSGVAILLAMLPSPQPQNAIGIQYNFYVVANQAPAMKILFGDSRFFGPASFTGSPPDTYVINDNIYSNTLLYTNPVVTTWPLLGQNVQTDASLRISQADFTDSGLTAVRTLDPVNFPRQSYWEDGNPKIPQSDMISQFGLNGQQGTVTILRGPIITDYAGWAAAGTPLQTTVAYREWDVTATINSVAHQMMVALPDADAHNVYPLEMLVFGSEFWYLPGLEKIYYWNVQYQTDSSTSWVPIYTFNVNRYGGNGTDYGFKKTVWNGNNVIEMSNDGTGPYVPLNGTIDLTP
ncbi:MAG: Ig-like domain-containing protein [Fimbriimonadaceae bacterium]